MRSSVCESTYVCSDLSLCGCGRNPLPCAVVELHVPHHECRNDRIVKHDVVGSAVDLTRIEQHYRVKDACVHGCANGVNYFHRFNADAQLSCISARVQVSNNALIHDRRERTEERTAFHGHFVYGA